MFVSSFLAKIITFVGGIAAWVFLFRFWLQFARASFNNPLVQSLYQFLAPVLRPFERVIPKFRNANLACLTLAYLVCFVTMALAMLVSHGQALFQSSGFMVTLISALWLLLNTAYWMIFIKLILFALMSFVMFRDASIVMLITQLVGPMIAPVRRLVPNVGPFDFSVAIVVLLLSLTFFSIEYLLMQLMQSLIV